MLSTMAAATPEKFLREVGDVEPFSPSLFLDLPPTPTQSTRPPPPDLGLDFISRMLMEEDIHDDFFCQYPNHPAILTAQQPFEQIISGYPSSPFSSDSAADDNTIAPASPTWSYDPIELSQLLQCPPSIGLNSDFPADDASILFFPNDGAPTAGYFVQDKRDDSFATAERNSGQDVLVSAFFNDQTDSHMAMLNMAFRKGMEEANKFLPTSTTFPVYLDAIAAGSHAKEVEPDVLRTSLMFGNGKKRHGVDDLEAETGRNSKLMSWKQEEIWARETVDEAMLHGYEICLNGMEDLRIAMGTDAEKRNRKATRDDVVDLRTMLIHCAQAVASGDRRGSGELLRQIRQHSSPKGDATQRLAYCFAEGLEARLAGTGSQVYKSLVAKSTSVVHHLKAYKLYMAASSFMKVSRAFVGKTIINAMEGKSRLHIVDYNVQYGFRWPGLLKWLATREGGPPEVRFTGIDLPQPGFHPAFQMEETRRRLSNCAREFGLPFKFQGIVAKWETLRAEDLNIDPDEVLVVISSECGFSTLMEESVVIADEQDCPSPRDMVLGNIRKMRPDVFIECVVNGTYGAPFFMTRFREALFFYSTQFDMLDATIPRDNDERQIIERDILGPCALNVIACEGVDRVDRPETYKQWQVRSYKAGLRQLPLNPKIVKVVLDKSKNHYHKDVVIDVDHRWLLLGWKGRVVYAMSAWVASEDDNSKF
ncbi:unnamed protein product [Alopecurus aequalis]